MNNALNSFKINTSQVFLEIEVNSRGKAEFEKKYLEYVGELPKLGTGYQLQDNKWGSECRIYFNSDSNNIINELKIHGIEVESGDRPYKSNLKYRINNNEFFWNLISEGYRLGQN